MSTRESVPASMPTGWLARAVKIAGTVAGNRAQSAVDQLRRSADGTAAAAAAVKMVNTLGNLRGAAMKVGQMLSYMDPALPADVRKVFARLQAQAPSMPPGHAERVFEEDFGNRPEQVFSEWSSQPIAAASIGQVHRARLRDGAAVAVKIQYPDIARAMSSDLKNLSIVEPLGRLLAPSIDSRAIVAEIRERMLEECDYRREANNQSLFREIFRHDPHVHVPAVIGDFVSTRVITTEFFDGVDFVSFIENATVQERNRTAEHLIRAVFGSIFQHSVLNCDPHPGNYLFQAGRVALLDFGCVKHFTPDVVGLWRKMIRAGIGSDRATFDGCVDEFRIPQGKKFDYDFHYRMSRVLYEPFLEDRPFAYTEQYVAKCNDVLMKQNPNKKCAGLPADLVFANRLQWGLNSVLVSLGAFGNWHRVLMPILEQDATGQYGTS